MKVIHVLLLAIVLFGCSVIAGAKPVDPRIGRAVQRFTDKNSQGIGKVKITSSDVRGNWALIWAESLKKQADPAQYLLRKEKGVWKVLVMGTALIGTGEEYKVPTDLRRKWNL